MLKSMGIRLIFLNLLKSDKVIFKFYIYWIISYLILLSGNNFMFKTVPQTDTGGWIEYIKALEITILKELGKMPP